MGKFLVVAAYTVYVAFWVRLSLHLLLWWRVARRFRRPFSPLHPPRLKAFSLTALDILFFGRLLARNPALWLGEWVFHATLLLVFFRHLRFFLDPVPSWVWSMQIPGLISGYLLPLSLLYILLVRLLSKRERYSSPANMFLIVLLLCIGSIGVLMQVWFKPDLVAVKYFTTGLASLRPVSAPENLLFATHFLLVLVLALFVPSHIFSAPLVMWEARKREQGLPRVMHDE
jgi:nitrate reductase gamma subunit